MRHRRDLFVASRNPFAARWSTLSPLSFAQTPLAVPVAASPDDADPEEEDEGEEDDEDLDDADGDEFDDDEDEDTDEEVDEDSEQTAEPEGQFPNAPDALKDAERPGAPQNRHGDRGGVS